MDGPLPESVCFSSDVDDSSVVTFEDCSQDDAGIGGGKKRLDRELPRRQDNQETITDLKIQVAGHQQEIFKLKSEVCHYRKVNELLKVESEALLTKTTTLINELARATRGNHQAIPAKRQCLPKTNGPIKMLVDANSRLMTENDRLEVANDVLHKTYNSYIDGARKKMGSDKRTIEKLRRENEQLTARLQKVETSCPAPSTQVYHKKLSTKSLDGSHRTAETEELSVSFKSSLTRSSTTPAQDNWLRSSFLSQADSMFSTLNSIPEQESNSVRSASLQDKRGILEKTAHCFSFYKPKRSADNMDEAKSNGMSSTSTLVDETLDHSQGHQEARLSFVVPTAGDSMNEYDPEEHLEDAPSTNSFQNWFSSQKANLSKSMTSEVPRKNSIDFGDESVKTNRRRWHSITGREPSSNGCNKRTEHGLLVDFGEVPRSSRSQA